MKRGTRSEVKRDYTRVKKINMDLNDKNKLFKYLINKNMWHVTLNVKYTHKIARGALNYNTNFLILI